MEDKIMWGAQSAQKAIAMTPKQQCEKLMNASVPFAGTMLSEYGQFHCYGAYLKRDGEIIGVGAEKEPSGAAERESLKISFTAMASDEKSGIVAFLIISNVALGEAVEGMADAIEVILDHEDGYSATIFIPYEIVVGTTRERARSVTYGRIFAQALEERIYPCK